MQKVRLGLSVSLDGFVAGPSQSEDTPLGVGGERLHEWAFATRSMRALHGMEGGEEGTDDLWAARHDEQVGATIMGRNMFGPTRGPWGHPAWGGWWGADPPFHHPVFVLTHHARASLELGGGTTFHFVTGGIHEALQRARDAAGAADVRIGGGARTARQFLEAALIDEIHLAIVPVLLGSGERLFETLPEVGGHYESVEAIGGERALHVRLIRRVGR
ncbi:MAG: dihydrofolate reductase family protein [Gemmatimonadales bacterium]|nr:MAG: dihydrofolate reductase family protein [Gemmatimonadales bacterium]